MRYAIETAPRDGKVVILEDDASATYDVAHWSAEAGEWVGENGEPGKITPTHWHPMPRDEYLLQADDQSSNPSQLGPSASRARGRSFFPSSSSRAAPQRSAASEGIAPRSVAMAAPVSVEALTAQTAPIEAKGAPRAWRRVAAFWISATLIAAAIIGLYFHVSRAAGQQDIRQEIQLPSQNSPKADLAAFRQYTETDQARAQAGALVRQALEASASEARQSLEKEHRLVVLANELAEARRAIEARNLQIDARDRQLREMENELAMVRGEIETNIALLTELQQERDRAEALSLELAMARESPQRAIDTRVTLKRAAKSQTAKRAANSQTAQMPQVIEAAASEQSAAAVSQGDLEVARLMVRASALLGQGNISAARIVLARAVDTGSARASFTLAETYDPVILSTWGTYGTRGDATKAREHYAKAHAGGIQEAKDRLDALGP
jgi:hypothetical protein